MDDEEGEDVGENFEEVNGIFKDIEFVFLLVFVVESDLFIIYIYVLFLIFVVFGFSFVYLNCI